MTTETTTRETTTATEKPQRARGDVPKTASISLRAGDNTMRLVAVRRADGTATTFVTTAEGDKPAVRGMTQQHASFEAANAAITALAADAQKKGWTRKPVGRGFVAKPDAFSSLPAAPKAAPKAGKAKGSTKVA